MDFEFRIPLCSLFEGFSFCLHRSVRELLKGSGVSEKQWVSLLHALR